MFLGTVGDVLCGPGVVRDGGSGSAFRLRQIYCTYFGLLAVVAMDIAHYRALMQSSCRRILCL